VGKITFGSLGQVWSEHRPKQTGKPPVGRLLEEYNRAENTKSSRKEPPTVVAERAYSSSVRKRNLQYPVAFRPRRVVSFSCLRNEPGFPQFQNWHEVLTHHPCQMPKRPHRPHSPTAEPIPVAEAERAGSSCSTLLISSPIQSPCSCDWLIKAKLQSLRFPPSLTVRSMVRSARPRRAPTHLPCSVEKQNR